MDDIALRLGIGDLCAAYADCIDDDRLEEWPDFFVDDCRYLITDRESHQAGFRHGVIYCASLGMLEVQSDNAKQWNARTRDAPDLPATKVGRQPNSRPDRFGSAMARARNPYPRVPQFNIDAYRHVPTGTGSIS